MYVQIDLHLIYIYDEHMDRYIYIYIVLVAWGSFGSSGDKLAT